MELKRKAVQFFLRGENCIAWAPYMQEICSYFASNGKFFTSLNKVFVSKYLLVIFLLLFIDSFHNVSFFAKPVCDRHNSKLSSLGF